MVLNRVPDNYFAETEQSAFNPSHMYRVMDEPARARLIANIAGSLAQVSREDIIERSIENFRKADPEYGRRLADTVAARRKK